MFIVGATLAVAQNGVIVHNYGDGIKMTSYNPEIHHRRSIRLKGYDYSSKGAYFVTICTHNRACMFEQYPSLRIIIETQWKKNLKDFTDVNLDEFIIMPNHIHGIIFVGAGLAPAPIGLAPAQNESNDKRATARVAPTIGMIIGQYKSKCVHEWLTYIKENNLNALGRFWQRNYYEHIIRNDAELNHIREYVINNPLQWAVDDYYPGENKNV